MLSCLWVLSHSRVNSFKKSVRPHKSALRPLNRCPRNLILVTFTEICRKNPHLVKIEKKCGTLHENLTTFYSWRRHKFATKAYLCNTKIWCCWQWSVTLPFTHKHCCVSTVKMVMRTCQIFTSCSFCPKIPQLGCLICSDVSPKLRNIWKDELKYMSGILLH
jgi:hypothetical protein